MDDFAWATMCFDPLVTESYPAIEEVLCLELHLGAQSTFLLQATLIYLLLGLLSTLWTSSTSKSSHMKARSLLFARLPIT